MICTISTKTTGLKPGSYEVIELSIKPLGQETVTFRVKPDRPEIYEENVQKINGISKIVAETFPTKLEVAEKALSTFKDITPVGHYFRFDYDMLVCTFGNQFIIDLFGKNRAIDTAILIEKDNIARIERGEIKRFKSNSLKKVAEVLEIPFTHKCEVIEKVYWRLADGK